MRKKKRGKMKREGEEEARREKEGYESGRQSQDRWRMRTEGLSCAAQMWLVDERSMKGKYRWVKQWDINGGDEGKQKWENKRIRSPERERSQSIRLCLASCSFKLQPSRPSELQPHLQMSAFLSQVIAFCCFFFFLPGLKKKKEKELPLCFLHDLACR